jgi:hypothetical protein
MPACVRGCVVCVRARVYGCACVCVPIQVAMSDIRATPSSARTAWAFSMPYGKSKNTTDCSRRARRSESTTAVNKTRKPRERRSSAAAAARQIHSCFVLSPNTLRAFAGRHAQHTGSAQRTAQARVRTRAGLGSRPRPCGDRTALAHEERVRERVARHRDVAAHSVPTPCAPHRAAPGRPQRAATADRLKPYDLAHRVPMQMRGSPSTQAKHRAALRLPSVGARWLFGARTRRPSAARRRCAQSPPRSTRAAPLAPVGKPRSE